MRAGLRHIPRMARRRRPRRLGVIAAAVFVLVPVTLILPLRWLPPLATSFMAITWVTKDDRAGDLRYDWVSRAVISPNAAAAVLAAEDQKFFAHAGFDLQSIGRAIRQNERSRRVIRGASTISQQVAKNLFLWPGRSWLRKGIEAWLTVWIELLLPKERILELHLNIAQFGPAVFGVEAASRLYFGRPAARLNRDQAALLAAVLPNPLRLSVPRPSSYVRRRQAWIMSQAVRLERTGLFSPRQWRQGN
jgi:monofunctional biosynthetic peptidoglycan transglycosylase